MSELTSKQRKYLRANAHNLNPLVMVGKDGVSAGLVDEIKQALLHHELIKIKFVDGKEDRKALTEEIANASEAHIAGVIGNVSILYREHPEREKRKFDPPV